LALIQDQSIRLTTIIAHPRIGTACCASHNQKDIFDIKKPVINESWAFFDVKMYDFSDK
jgi:hypothetical protein